MKQTPLANKNSSRTISNHKLSIITVVVIMLAMHQNVKQSFDISTDLQLKCVFFLVTMFQTNMTHNNQHLTSSVTSYLVKQN